MPLFGMRNPSDAASKYINQIPGLVSNAYNPYINFGQTAGSDISNTYQQLAANPAEFYNQLMKNYQPSEGYKLQRDEALRAAGNSAAAGGMTGTSQDQITQARIAQGLQGEDMQRWYQNVANLFGAGLQGQQGLYNTGYDASSKYASDMANVLGTQGSLAYQGTANRNKQIADLIQALGGTGMAIAGLPVAGGGSLGGNYLQGWMK